MFCVSVMRAVWRRDDGLKGSKHVGLFIKSVLSDFSVTEKQVHKLV